MNFKIGKFFNIPLYLNLYTVPFVLMLCSSSPNFLLSITMFVISIFFVVLHEYGHCLMARKYKMKVVDITILPIGGVAQIHFKYDKPISELAVALAGPAVNVFLALIFSTLALIGIWLDDSVFLTASVLALASNVMIVAFNLLPVFPMDGGRVLRASLSRKLGHERATFYAVRVGQINGCVLAAFAFYYQYWLAGIIFIFMGLVSQSELSAAKLINSIYNIRLHLAARLNKPELTEATLPELILAIQSIQDDELKNELKTDILLNFMQDLERSNFSI